MLRKSRLSQKKKWFSYKKTCFGSFLLCYFLAEKSLNFTGAQSGNFQGRDSFLESGYFDKHLIKKK